VKQCVFCQIAAGTTSAAVVYEDEEFIAFLDSRPLFPGHLLAIPKKHYETLPDVPPEHASSLMLLVQRLSVAVEHGMQAEGTFVAVNNRVSQSVPHLHVHVVPRRRKDGLRGFFWPRQPYPDEPAMEAARDAIQKALTSP
jgi:histidine triad (HIT) family protein